MSQLVVKGRKCCLCGSIKSVSGYTINKIRYRICTKCISANKHNVLKTTEKRPIGI